MRKLTSNEIEWLDGDVVAVVSKATNTVMMRYSFYPPDLNDSLYMVEREKEKTVWDAVNHFKGRAQREVGTIIESIKQDPEYGGDIGDLWCVNLHGNEIYSMYYRLVCTTREFSQCVDDLAKFANKDNSPSCYNYDTHKKYNQKKESKAIEEKSVYTQAMKDAGELPKVGMMCLLKNDIDAELEYGHDAINKNVVIHSIVHNNTIATVRHDDGAFYCLRVDMLYPADTRTPKQKQADVIVKFIAQNVGCSNSELVAEMQKAGFFVEPKP